MNIGKETIIPQHESQIDGLLVVDGLDGSENYANKTNWPYGTMVAMADVANPKYDNFTTAAVCMEEEGWIVLATTEGENPGVFVIDNSNGNVHKLSKFDQTGDFDEANILADNYFPEAKGSNRESPGIGRETNRVNSSNCSINGD